MSKNQKKVHQKTKKMFKKDIKNVIKVYTKFRKKVSNITMPREKRK